MQHIMRLNPSPFVKIENKDKSNIVSVITEIKGE